MKGEVGSFNFDESLNVDGSGNKNILLGNIKRGLGINGIGISAILNGRDPLVLKNMKIYNTEEFSYTFWVFVHSFQKESAYCPIIWKGDENISQKKFDRVPAIFVNAKTGKIKVYITVMNEDGTPISEPTAGLTAETLGAVQSNKWTFVAVTVNKKTIRVHLNGILDGIQNLEKYKIKINTSDIYIGGVPPVTKGNQNKDESNMIDELKILGNCNMKYNIDEFKIFD